MRFAKLALALSTLLILATVLPTSAVAQTKTWSGGGINNNWTTGLNWVGGLAPAPGDSLVFDTFARLTPNNNFAAGTQFGGITFGPTAGPFTLTGNALTLVGNITDNTPILTETINLPIVLGATTNVSVADNAFLLLASPVSGGFTISKTGNGTLTLGAANTFSGPLMIQQGVVSVSADNNLGSIPPAPSPGRIIINGGTLRATTGFALNANRGIGLGPVGGTFDVTSGQTLTYGGVIAFDGAGTGGLTKVRFGALFLSGANTYIGPTNVRNGALVLNFADAAATTPVTNIINPSSPLSLGGATAGLGQNNNATLTMTGKAAVNNVQTFASTNIDIYGSVINVTNGSGGTATLNLGALTHTLGGTVVIPTNLGTVNTTTTVATTNGILGGWAVAGTPDVQRGITMGNAYATVDASGKIVPYTAHVAAPEYSPGNNATLLRNDPAIVANADKNVKFTGDAVSKLMRVDLENAGTTTDINTLAFTTNGANNTLTIGTGNTLRLGKFGGIYKQVNGNNQLYIGGSLDQVLSGNGVYGTPSAANPIQVGFLTAGGPTLGSPGEIVLTTNETANNNGTLNILANIVDNGPGGTVTLIKTSVSSIKIDGHNTYSGGTFINQGRFQLAGSEVERKPNPVPGGAELTFGNPDGLGTGPVTIAPGGYLFVSGVNGTGLFTGNGAIAGALPNTAQNAPIVNNITLSGIGTSQEGIGAIRLGGKAVLTGQITLGGDARIGGSSNNGNTDVAYDTFPAINPDGTTLYIDPGHLLSGKITGPFGLDVGSNVSISTNFKISNPANDWSGDTTFVTGGGTTRLRIGANEVIPHGPGKGNLVWGPLVSANVARFDLNGFNETVNGLSTTTTNLASAIIENNGFTATITGEPGLKSYTFTAGTATLTVGGFDQSATFGGVIRDSDTARSVNLPDPNGGTTPIALVAPWVNAGAKVALTKIGTGIQTLSGANTYTGPTTINGGTLSITGSLASGSDVAVNAGGTLSGAGDGGTTGIVGNVTMAAGSSIAPGATSALGSVGRLTMTRLTVNGGDLKFNLVTPDASDQINVTGPVSFTAASTITPNGGVAGTYTVLATTAGPITYGVTPTVTPFVDPLSRPTGYALDTASDTSAIKLTVTGGPKTLSWTGSQNSDWDINTSTNWTDGAIAEKFFNNDLVTFGDVTNRNVNLTTTVLPSSVTVNNSAGMNYTFGGPGGIGAASLGLTKSGAGTLTLASNNTYTGPTTISGGTIEVGNGGTSGTLGGGDVANSGTLIFNRSDAMTAANAISGTGELRKIGAGNVTLTGVNSYTGPTNIASGTLTVTNSNSLGAVPGTVVNISSGAALDLAGATAANSLNFGDAFGPKQFNIAGTGVGGTGAITNSGTVAQLNAFQSITLTGNATVGGTGRFDIRDVAAPANLDLAGFTLTKTGPNQFTLVGTTVTAGNIVVNEGVFALETTTVLSSGAAGTLTFNAPASGITALQFFNLTGDVTRPMVFNGNGILIGNASGAAQPSAFGSNLTLNGDVIFTNLNNSAGALSVNGIISETGGPRSITKNGPTMLTLTAANTYTGTTTINDGILRVVGSINTNNAVTVAGPATFEVHGSASSVGGISGAGVTTVGDGSFGTVLTASHVRQSTLTINLGSEVKTKTGGGTSVFGTLAIAGDATPTAKLDLANNSAIVDYPAAGPNPTTTVRDQIIAGRGGPGLGKTWNGLGITSSQAAADPVNSTSVGYADNSALPLGAKTTFGGQPVDNSSVLMRYTRTGDANLDGVVNNDDVTIVGANYAPGFAKPHWALGDFDFNGFVDNDDVTLLGVYYNPSATPIPAPSAESASVAAVPEPATLALLALGFAAVAVTECIRRRRREN